LSAPLLQLGMTLEYNLKQLEYPIMDQSMLPRRKFLITLPALVLLSQTSAATAQEVAPTLIDASSVKDVRELVALIRTVAGNRLPPNLKDEEFYKEFAREAIANLQLAINEGVQVPQFLLDRLSNDQTEGSLIPAGFPILMLITLFGIRFLMPVSTYFRIILSSLWIMYIYLDIEARKQSAKAFPGKTQSDHNSKAFGLNQI